MPRLEGGSKNSAPAPEEMPTQVSALRNRARITSHWPLGRVAPALLPAASLAESLFLRGP